MSDILLNKEAGFIGGLTRAVQGATKMNKAKGITGLSAVKNQAQAGLKNVQRYATKNPGKAAVGGLAAYGGYRALKD